jgi:hypothetical protein
MLTVAAKTPHRESYLDLIEDFSEARNELGPARDDKPRLKNTTPRWC